MKIGTLVTWNVKGSRDYGCLGLVTSLCERGEFDRVLYINVLWADESNIEYDLSDINDKNIKVVKF